MPAGRARISYWIRSTEGGLLLSALVVGAGAGLGAVVFRWLIATFTQLLTGFSDYSNAGRAANPNFPWLGPYFVVLAPVVAGLLYGPLVHFFAREARGHGVPEVMYAVARRGGYIAPRVAVVKSLASALCIGGGGSVGREGPIVQIGSALGSTIGHVMRMPEQRMRLLVACGAAGGIAATFNAPLAGVFFAMELILVDFAARSFGMVVLSSVTASVIGRAAFGDQPFLQLPAFNVTHLQEYLFFALLGVMAGGVGVIFTKALYGIEDICDHFWRWGEWLRPAVGGILLGALLLALPQMYGVGYPILGAGVRGDYAIGFLLILLVGKILATSLSIGIGGSGGVFAPSLFIGAMLGAAFGDVLQVIAPSWTGPAGAYALIGMGAVFAGAARAPITAVLIMFELTGDYGIILPLMAAIVLATLISRRVSPDTIYTLKLRRRGIDLAASPSTDPIAGMTVGQVMVPVPRLLTEDTSLIDAAASLARSGQGVLPVIDTDGAYRGTVTARAVAEALTREENDTRPVGSLTEMPDPVARSSSLEDALGVLDRAIGSAVPVLDEDAHEVVGWLTQQDMLRTMRRSRSKAPAGPTTPETTSPAGRPGPSARPAPPSAGTVAPPTTLPAESDETEPDETEPDETEPDETEPDTAEAEGAVADQESAGTAGTGASAVEQAPGESGGRPDDERERTEAERSVTE